MKNILLHISMSLYSEDCEAYRTSRFFTDGLISLSDKPIQKVMLISPIIAMEKLILDMLKRVGISEKACCLQTIVNMPYGETVSSSEIRSAFVPRSKQASMRVLLPVFMATVVRFFCCCIFC